IHPPCGEMTTHLTTTLSARWAVGQGHAQPRQPTKVNRLAIRQTVGEDEHDAVETDRPRAKPVAERQMTFGQKRKAAGFALIGFLLFSPSVFAIKTIDYQRRLNPKFTKR